MMTRFDPTALYQALDDEPRARGMSWQQLATEIDVSGSTITHTRKGGRMEVDGMPAMVGWLGRSTECFTREVSR